MDPDLSQGLVLPRRGATRDRDLIAFAETLVKINASTGFKVSARGWCYQLEGFRLINKNQFNIVEGLINECRSTGILPIDFTAEEEGRQFSGVEEPTPEGPVQFMRRYLDAVLHVEDYYTPNWWSGEKYYIQMIVEKIDLKTLFTPVCEQYYIPIATAKGWSSILQRGEYARRFAEAEQQGLECVLLYAGDLDPDGGRISDFIRSNLDDLKDVQWSDGTAGYDPAKLKIDRFGLNYDFVIENNLTWIDNLITGSGGEIAKIVDGKIVQGKAKSGKPHPNFPMDYVQEYLRTIGVRKCEANALVIRPKQSQALCRDAIEKYLGKDARIRFNKRSMAVKATLDDFRQRTGISDTIREAIGMITNEVDDDDE